MSSLRSPYTLDNPPPMSPPAWVLSPRRVNDWLAAAKLWRRHTPEPLDHRPRPQWRCRACGSVWVCEWWLFADRVLAAIFVASCRPLAQPPGAAPRAYRRRSF